jgi:hypothetical protein
MDVRDLCEFNSLRTDSSYELYINMVLNLNVFVVKRRIFYERGVFQSHKENCDPSVKILRKSITYMVLCFYKYIPHMT